MGPGGGSPDVEALVREGRHAEAAERCLEAGDPLRASELFAAVWQWERAVDAALGAERFDRAFAHALEAGEPALRARVTEGLASRPDQAARAAREAARRGKARDAARLWEAVGETETAAAQYEAAGAWLDAGRCREALGGYRAAGELYERAARQTPWDGEAALSLGRLLAQFARYEPAARALQTAVRDPAVRTRALRLLVACFDALGMPEAAAESLARLRAHDPAMAFTVPEFLEECFGDARGLSALGRMPAEDLLAGRYRVRRSLGAGATGRVVLAFDVFFDREVAIKILATGAGIGGRDAHARFAREASIAAGLEHPNVVRVYEYHPAGPWLVMEHMTGGTLEERLDEARSGGRPVSPARTRPILRAVLEGLGAVHRRGVVHRDIKPANVFFGREAEVKVGDFGVAHLVDLGATLTGPMLGTLAYMAPEQITGADRPSAATDLYAVGVLMFEMLAGRHPYPGPDVLTQHLEAPVPRGSEVAPALGDAYDALLRSLLDKEPGARPQSADEVLETMDALPWPEGPQDAGEDRAAAVDPGASDAETDDEDPERYLAVEPAGDGGAAAFRDRRLDRLVWIRRCEAGELARWRAQAPVDGPHLQAILDVDAERGRVVLEAPRGRPLGRGIAPGRRARVRAQVRSALERLHAQGLAHGQPDEDHIVVGPGRAVLLRPGAPAEAGASLEQDLATLDQALERMELA